ncbi:peptidase S8, partial [Alkalihalophilus lindianensis]|nr:peptidase S8 [Alkalihalophilus lindianensis]
ALIKQAHPNWTPKQIKSALMNTAKPLDTAATARDRMASQTKTAIRSTPGRYRTFEQGAGRIQVAEAIKTETLVSPGSIRFGKYTD